MKRVDGICVDRFGSAKLGLVLCTSESPHGTCPLVSIVTIPVPRMLQLELLGRGLIMVHLGDAVRSYQAWPSDWTYHAAGVGFPLNNEGVLGRNPFTVYNCTACTLAAASKSKCSRAAGPGYMHQTAQRTFLPRLPKTLVPAQ